MSWSHDIKINDEVVTFIDYKFALCDDGSIRFDEELNLDSLKAKSGDLFMLRIEKDHVIFRKIHKPFAVVPYPPGP